MKLKDWGPDDIVILIIVVSIFVLIPTIGLVGYYITGGC